MFEADKGVFLEEALQAGRRGRELRRESDFDTAAWPPALAGDRAGRYGNGNLQTAFETPERGLLYGDRYRRGNLLRDAQPILGTARLVAGVEFPDQGFAVFRCVGRPLDFAGAFGVELELLRLQRLLASLGGDGHRHRLGGAVTHRQQGAVAVFFAYQRRQAGNQLQILFGTQLAAAAAKEADTGIGDGDQLELGQRIVERHLDDRAAFGIQRQTRVPDEQRVKEFARRGAAATTTRGHGFLAEVPFADHLRLRGGGIHLIGAFGQHHVEQIPAFVGPEFEQRLIDCRKGDFRPGRNRFAVRLRDLDLDLGGFAWLIVAFFRGDFDLQFERVDADIQCGQPQLERRFGKVDHHRRLGRVPPFLEPGRRFAPAPGEEGVPLQRFDATAHGQHRDIDVRSPFALDRQFDHRFPA